MSYVYILSNESMPGIYKVGKTYNRLTQRAKELYTTGVPTPFHIESQYQVYNCDAVEKKAHQILHHCRVNRGREFFRHDKTAIEEVILLAIELTDDALGKDSVTFADLELRRQEKAREQEIAEAQRRETQRLKGKKEKEAAELEKYRKAAFKKQQAALAAESKSKRDRFAAKLGKLGLPILVIHIVLVNYVGFDDYFVPLPFRVGYPLLVYASFIFASQYVYYLSAYWLWRLLGRNTDRWLDHI